MKYQVHKDQRKSQAVLTEEAFSQIFECPIYSRQLQEVRSKSVRSKDLMTKNRRSSIYLTMGGSMT